MAGFLKGLFRGQAAQSQESVAVTAQCAPCGAAVKLQLPAGAAKPPLLLCANCGEQQFLADGGMAWVLRTSVPEATFSIGKRLRATQAAVQSLAECDEPVWEFLKSHASGQGTVESGRDNVLYSEFRTQKGERFWIVSHVGSHTTLMLPHEYST